MSKLIIAVSLFVATLAVSAANAQCAATVTIEATSNGGKSIDLYACGEGTFAYACASKNWGELYVGKTYSPAPWIELAAGVVFETGQDTPRFGGSVWAGEDRFSFLHLWEQGGSGPWHKTKVMYQTSDELHIGLIDRAFYGCGITAEYKLGSSSKLSAAWYDSGKGTVSLSTSF